MTRSKKVFLTSSIFFAFIDRQHPKHAQAEAFFRYFAQENFHLYTSLNEVLETHQDLQKHVGFSVARDFLRTIFLGSIEIAYPDEAVTKNSLKLLATNGNSSLNLTLEHALINTLADKLHVPQIASFSNNVQFYFGIQPFTLPY